MRRHLLILAAVALVSAACGNADDHSMPMNPDGPMNPTDGGMHDEDDSPVADGARRIAVTAADFQFDPEEIRVAVGEEVAIVLTSRDILHDFTVDELDVHVAADAEDTAEGGLRADEAGEYAFYCSVAGHRAAGMKGTLLVE